MVVVRVLFKLVAIELFCGLWVVIMIVIFGLLCYLFWFILVFCWMFDLVCVLLLCVYLVWLLFRFDVWVSN